MDQYEYIDVIGEGTYGQVLRCRHRDTGAVVAIKRFKESADSEYMRTSVRRELTAARLLARAPNIVPSMDTFCDGGRLHLVMECIPDTLLDLLDRQPDGLTLERLRVLLYTLLTGVQSCHARGIIHRDIKPENILVKEDGSAYLCDFGFSRPVTSTDAAACASDDPGAASGAAETGARTAYVSTRWYRSPEMLLRVPHYGFEVDLWAVGAILAEAADGAPLLPGKTELEQLALIEHRVGALPPRLRNPLLAPTTHTSVDSSHYLERRYLAKLGPRGVDLLTGLLATDGARRLTVQSALVHAFFNDDPPHHDVAESNAPTGDVSRRPRNSSSRTATPTSVCTRSPAPPHTTVSRRGRTPHAARANTRQLLFGATYGRALPRPQQQRRLALSPHRSLRRGRLGPDADVSVHAIDNTPPRRATSTATDPYVSTRETSAEAVADRVTGCSSSRLDDDSSRRGSAHDAVAAVTPPRCAKSHALVARDGRRRRTRMRCVPSPYNTRCAILASGVKPTRGSPRRVTPCVAGRGRTAHTRSTPRRAAARSGHSPSPPARPPVTRADASAQPILRFRARRAVLRTTPSRSDAASASRAASPGPEDGAWVVLPCDAAGTGDGVGVDGEGATREEVTQDVAVPAPARGATAPSLFTRAEQDVSLHSICRFQRQLGARRGKGRLLLAE